jgi:tetratricopeptide (TPR) repeat protein
MPSIEKLFAQAVERHRAGDLKQAGALYQQILAAEPEHAPSLHLMGALAFELGQIEPAINLMAVAISIDDQIAAYHNDLGEAYRAAGRIDEAADCYVQAIRLENDHAGALNNLGILLHGAGRHDEAIELYRRAIATEPKNAPTRMNLGAALIELGRPDEAAAELEAAQRLAPKDPKVALNLGNARQAQGRLDEAIAIYRSLLKTQPDNPEAQVNLGRALTESGRPHDSLACYAAALAQAPDLPGARFNEGISHLLLGDLPRGWDGFAWRWRADAVPPHGLPGPAWDGAPLEGARLLVHAEQGLGDTIQFARYLKDLAARGAGSVTLLCQPPLVGLLGRVAGVTSAVGPDRPLPDWDLRVPLLELPRLFGTTNETIDGAVPYLPVEPARIAAWRERLAGPSIGLVWQGRRTHRNDRNRSLPAASLAPLLARRGHNFVSLQKDAGPGDLAMLAGAGPITDLGEAFADFEELAAAVAALDLVITVDTAIAHLAGALGRPVWILLPYAPDWRWQLDRRDSPWYPTARLFRQTKPGGWSAPIAEIATRLTASAANAY